MNTDIEGNPQIQLLLDKQYQSPVYIIICQTECRRWVENDYHLLINHIPSINSIWLNVPEVNKDGNQLKRRKGFVMIHKNTSFRWRCFDTKEAQWQDCLNLNALLETVNRIKDGWLIERSVAIAEFLGSDPPRGCNTSWFSLHASRRIELS